MTFKNPLNRFRGAELKEPIIQQRSLAARDVRKFLSTHPDGSTQDEVRAACGENAGYSLHYLRKRRFARIMPWNDRRNARGAELWFASEPCDPYWEAREKA